jgi:DHA2 family multidrug resistance protein
VFLNANLLGYVSVIALFGAEFLMPVYLQALRGRTAFETGLILLPMAVSGGIMTPLAGRIYDKVGPRLLLTAGFGILIINTWQLSLLTGDTPITWIMVLLALRGLALGLTVQTTMVAALSVVPIPEIAIGSSLTNATRQVVQSVGVAVLATVLASTISPQVATLQSQIAAQSLRSGHPTSNVGICEIASGTAVAGLPSGSPSVGPLLQEACDENVAGFERAYRVTFFAAFVALALGLFLPGWPLKWQGRESPGVPTPGH